MAIFQKGMPVQFVSGQDPARYPYVQVVATGDDARVPTLNLFLGDSKRATVLQAIANADTARYPLVKLAESFYIPFNDLGSGQVDTTLVAGTGSATFTRATTATTVNSAGTIISVASGKPRSYYDPTTLRYLGYLAEGSRQNLVLNSLIDGTDFSTQSVTVTAVAHTLSFYGTGTITLSGASTAGPLVGTGVYPQRVSLTFTPAAASLTLTVTGSCKFVQLEIGSFASSFIPTAGTAVTRDADVLTYPISGNLSATVGATYAEIVMPNAGASNGIIGDGGAVPVYNYVVSGALKLYDGTTVNTLTAFTPSNSVQKVATTWGGSTCAGAVNGTVTTGVFDGNMGSVGPIQIGLSSGSSVLALFGTIRNVRIWQTQFSEAQLQTLTT